MSSELRRDLESVADVVRHIKRQHDDWLEDVLAGLLSNGVARDEIDIQIHPGYRVVVAVRGVPKYEWSMTTTEGRVQP